MRLQGRTVLLTGATGGLGGAMADAFAGRGAIVIGTGRRAAELDVVARRTKGRGVVADLATSAGVEGLVAEAGAIDVLVANAAVPASGRLVDLDPELIGQAIDVNLRAPILLARALVPPMVERGYGHVVMVSSLSGLTATPATSVYNATKFGLRGFAHSLRQDLHGTGVGVSVLLPGFVDDAGMFANTGTRLPAGVGTSSSAQVAAAAIDAIERDRAEVAVAPFAIRLGAYLGGLVPGLAARFTRTAGGGRVADNIAREQRHYR